MLLSVCGTSLRPNTQSKSDTYVNITLPPYMQYNIWHVEKDNAMQIYTLAMDTDHGTTATAFLTREGAEDAMYQCLSAEWTRCALSIESFPDDVHEAYQRLIDAGSINSYTIEEHTLDLPSELLQNRFFKQGEHPEYTIKGWQGDVFAGETKKSYWEWAVSKIKHIQECA